MGGLNWGGAQLPNLGIIPQYIMGFIRQGEPVTNVMFRTYSAVVTGRTSTYLGMFKFAHYMKVPPKASFYAQVGNVLHTVEILKFSATKITLKVYDGK